MIKTRCRAVNVVSYHLYYKEYEVFLYVCFVHTTHPLPYAKTISKKYFKTDNRGVFGEGNWYFKGQVEGDVYVYFYVKNVWLQNNNELITCIKMVNHASFNIVNYHS